MPIFNPGASRREGEKKMKKSIALVLALVMVVALCACGGSKTEATKITYATGGTSGT